MQIPHTSLNNSNSKTIASSLYSRRCSQPFAYTQPFTHHSPVHCYLHSTYDKTDTCCLCSTITALQGLLRQTWCRFIFSYVPLSSVHFGHPSDKINTTSGLNAERFSRSSNLYGFFEKFYELSGYLVGLGWSKWHRSCWWTLCARR